MTSLFQSLLVFARRLAIAVFALVCVSSGTYVVRPGAQTPPAIIALAAEHEAELRGDVAPIMRHAVLRRAADPVRGWKHPHLPVPHPGAVPTPRGPPTPHGEPRGPPTAA